MFVSHNQLYGFSDIVSLLSSSPDIALQKQFKYIFFLQKVTIGTYFSWAWVAYLAVFVY